MRRGAAGAIALAALAPSRGEARAADLRAVAARVEAEWGKLGATVERGPTRFLYEDETMTVVVGPAKGARCTTVALLGARGVSFHAKVAGAEDDPLLDDPSARASSVAGVLQMERCEGDPIEHIVVISDAGRGAIETVVARSRSPLPPMKQVLPERTGGVLPPPPDAGPPPTLPPPAKRADQAETRVRRDGARLLPRETLAASADGSGEATVPLEPGCHRLELFASDAHAMHGGRRLRLDVDAELRDEDDELLARDRTDAADARLEACVGEAIRATIVYAGAPPSASVILTHARWPIPEHLPATWGGEARARMAKAMRARHAPDPPEDAVALYQGPAGATPIPITIEPGACYLAAAAVTHGHPRGLGLRAVLGARDVTDERSADDDSGVVTFCAHDRSTARLEVEARGVSLAWGLALFRLEGSVWEAGR